VALIRLPQFSFFIVLCLAADGIYLAVKAIYAILRSHFEVTNFYEDHVEQLSRHGIFFTDSISLAEEYTKITTRRISRRFWEQITNTGDVILYTPSGSIDVQDIYPYESVSKRVYALISYKKPIPPPITEEVIERAVTAAVQKGTLAAFQQILPMLPKPDPISQLVQLEQLLKSGAISPAEYKRAKDQIFANM
jgi:hypothetical protein